MATTTCTLTIKDDFKGEYEDDLRYKRADGQEVHGDLGRSRLTRAVVELLHRWVATYPQCTRQELMVLGKGLYEIAFGDAEPFSNEAPPLQQAFESTLDICRKTNSPLRLRLVIEAAATQLGTYPWEFLYMEGSETQGFFLAGENTRLTLTRYVPNHDSWERAPEDERDGRLRILVVVSTPVIPGMTELKVGGFVEQLLQLDDTRFRTERLDSPTGQELQHEIEALQPHVVHFIGHGRPGGLALRKDEETLAINREEFEDQVARREQPAPVSEAVWVDSYTACGLLRAGLQREDAPQRLIFLHACEGASAEQTRDVLTGFNDVARALVGGERITGVVAMQYTIGVDEAELFAKSFYKSISEGLRVDDAVRAARVEYATTPIRGRHQAWNDRGFGTPVIYLRCEDPLVAPPAKPDARHPEPEVPVPTVAAKESCPNPHCAGYVLRTAKLMTCRVCQYPYSVCPRCNWLVVPKPGFGCVNCDFVFEMSSPGEPTDGQGPARSHVGDLRAARADGDLAYGGYSGTAEVSRPGDGGVGIASAVAEASRSLTSGQWPYGGQNDGTAAPADLWEAGSDSGGAVDDDLD